VNTVRLVAALCAIAGAACIAAVVAGSPPGLAALAMLGTGLIALAATEVG